MAKLTKRAIDSFRYRGGWDVRWDADVPGFGIRLYPSGKKAFVLSYRASGRKRLMVLGRYGADLTLDQARERAQKHLVQVRDGADPMEERRRAAQGRTFGDLIDTYVERHAKVHKKTWRDDEQRLNRHVPASWRGRKAHSITREEIAELHDRIGRGTPYEANRLLEVLRKMFGLARIWHFTDESASNPAEGITRFKERKRKRWVTPLELPALAKAIDGEPNIYARAALWLYLLTGMRKEELTTAKWKDIDWDRGVLRLPETKSGEEQDAVLNAPALAILRSIPRLAGNPYILPGSKPRGHFTNIDRPWRRIRSRASVDLWQHDQDSQVSGLVERLSRELGRSPDVEEVEAAARRDGLELPTGLLDARLHDLRRTVGSWMSQASIDLNTIKEALRHSSISTTLTYARLGADPARQAMEEHGRRVMEIAGRQRVVETPRQKE